MGNHKNVDGSKRNWVCGLWWVAGNRCIWPWCQTWIELGLIPALSAPDCGPFASSNTASGSSSVRIELMVFWVLELSPPSSQGPLGTWGNMEETGAAGSKSKWVEDGVKSHKLHTDFMCVVSSLFAIPPPLTSTSTYNKHNQTEKTEFSMLLFSPGHVTSPTHPSIQWWFIEHL